MVAETSIRPMRSANTWEEVRTVIAVSILTDFRATAKQAVENPAVAATRKIVELKIE
jgi:hypothetical protein